MRDLGRELVQALADKDAGTLRALLAPDVDFGGLTPGRHWTASSADEVVEVLLGHWFEPHDEILEVRSVETGEVADRQRVSYQLGLRCSGVPKVTEQHVFYQLDEAGRITWMQAMCSGFRAEATPEQATAVPPQVSSGTGSA